MSDRPKPAHEWLDEDDFAVIGEGDPSDLADVWRARAEKAYKAAKSYLLMAAAWDTAASNAGDDLELEDLAPGYEGRWHKHHVARYVHQCADCRRERRAGARPGGRATDA